MGCEMFSAAAAVAGAHAYGCYWLPLQLLLLFPRQGHHGQGEIKTRFILSAMSVSRMSLPGSTQKTNI